MSKFCKDCKWMQAKPGLEGYEVCNAPGNMLEPDLVDGNINRRWQYCSTMRENGLLYALMLNMCGESGRWFEPK